MIKSAACITLGLIATVAAAAWWAGRASIAYGVILAGVWMLANGWAIAVVCRQLLGERPQRRWWPMIMPLAVKFPLLYGIGYLAIVWLRPSAMGLAIGVTLGLAALLVGYVRAVDASHG